jgi:hypothetical protein
MKLGESNTMLGLSGSVWVDTGYEKIKAGSPSDSNVKFAVQQARAVLRATPTYRSGDWFVQGQVELVGNNDQTQTQPKVVSTDDLWVRAGKWKAFDIQAGRFEAWELYHLGMGLDLNTLERRGANIDGSADHPPDFYGVTFAYYRPSGAGNVAAHIYFTDYLRLEALTRVGNDGGQNSIGERGALIFDIGWLKLKGGAEYIRSSDLQVNLKDRSVVRGGGGAVQFVIDPYVEFGYNAAYALTDVWDFAGAPNQGASYTIYSHGGFANARIVGDLIGGVGIDYTHKLDIHVDSNGNVGRFWHTQGFGALQYGLFRQLFLKVVVAYADAYLGPSFTSAPPYHNKMLSGRLRATYYF